MTALPYGSVQKELPTVTEVSWRRAGPVLGRRWEQTGARSLGQPSDEGGRIGGLMLCSAQPTTREQASQKRRATQVERGPFTQVTTLSLGNGAMARSASYPFHGIVVHGWNLDGIPESSRSAISLQCRAACEHSADGVVHGRLRLAGETTGRRCAHRTFNSREPRSIAADRRSGCLAPGAVTASRPTPRLQEVNAQKHGRWRASAAAFAR